MSDLISRKALLEDVGKIEIQNWVDNQGKYNSFIKSLKIITCIENAPAVEAVPVVHGKWTHTGYANEWECSHCKSQIALSDDKNSHPNFCGNCGADMRKKE